MLNPTFSRRLLLLHAIEHHEKASVPELMKSLGWPRRTLQDIIKALPGLGVDLEFVEDGVRHNDGHYRVTNWGPIDKQWVAEHKASLEAAVQG
ncbi:helix-turn-helix domain-containing protein [Ferrimonas aestuarii]|uniref:Helix-turn-helix domain-containing protein n=1 Tax=Ferrimonas aestuarii TaxID=2569539 RepID=A0A4U1BHK8_9GAMM|nr:helix-turn-helix domain-containing protein [Ferrimonas aestuarii]TKB50884.1 hypothetical protein FCL42_17970 [Ferrimonas aestuarii]